MGKRKLEGEGSQAIAEKPGFEEWERCRWDKVYFVGNYLQVFEPRAEFGAGWKPFKLWPRQVEY